MFQKQSRAFCGTIEIQAFGRFIEPATLVAIYALLPGDKTTSRNGAQGGFKLRAMHCGLGSVQHTTQIPHTPGHYDFLETAHEEDNWTSTRHSSPRAAQRERRERAPSPPPPHV